MAILIMAVGTAAIIFPIFYFGGNRYNRGVFLVVAGGIPLWCIWNGLFILAVVLISGCCTSSPPPPDEGNHATIATELPPPSQLSEAEAADAMHMQLPVVMCKNV